MPKSCVGNAFKPAAALAIPVAVVASPVFQYVMPKTTAKMMNASMVATMINLLLPMLVFATTAEARHHHPPTTFPPTTTATTAPPTTTTMISTGLDPEITPPFSPPLWQMPQVLGWGGFGNGMMGQLDAQGGMRLGFSGASIPTIPRGQPVGVNRLYGPFPANGRGYAVTQGGVTAIASPVTYPWIWESTLPLRQGQLVMPWWAYPLTGLLYRETGLGTWTCTERGIDPGSCCHTGAHHPTTWCQTVGCTMIDGDCTYTAVPATSDQTITDGSAVLTRTQAFDYELGNPVLQASGGQSLIQPNIHVGTQDNKSADAFTFSPPRQGWVPQWQNRLAGQYENVIVGINMGDGRIDHAVLNLGAFFGPPLRVMGPENYGQPTVPPTITLVPGAGTVSGHYCIPYAWEAGGTGEYAGGRTFVGPAMCLTADGTQAVTIAVPGPWPGNATPVLAIGGEEGGWGRLWQLRTPGETYTLTSSRLPEHESIIAGNDTGLRLLEVRNSFASYLAWAPTSPFAVDEIITPPVKNGYRYMVYAGGCDPACAVCAIQINGTTVTTSATPPTWTAPKGSFTCESGAGILYKNVGPDDASTLRVTSVRGHPAIVIVDEYGNTLQHIP